jgi:hypothetical protein
VRGVPKIRAKDEAVLVVVGNRLILGLYFGNVPHAEFFIAKYRGRVLASTP